MKRQKVTRKITSVFGLLVAASGSSTKRRENGKKNRYKFMY